MNELEVLEKVRSIFDQTVSPSSLVVENGDDGAVFHVQDANLAVSTDMAVENVHFKLDWSTPRQIGRKIAVANLADIFAMGGKPEYLLVSVGFPKSFLSHLVELAEGIFEEAGKVGAKVIGGDLSNSEKVVISITAIGRCNKPITRSNAQIGDLLLISHLPGWSAAGLALLRFGRTELRHAERAVSQHCAPEIDYEKYLGCFELASAVTDISDGLLLDASNIAQASQVSISIDTGSFMKCEDFSNLTELASSLKIDWQKLVLTGGEDHVLLVTANAPIPGFTQIGRVEAGEGVFVDGVKIDKGEQGFQHQW